MKLEPGWAVAVALMFSPACGRVDGDQGAGAGGGQHVGGSGGDAGTTSFDAATGQSGATAAGDEELYEMNRLQANSSGVYFLAATKDSLNQVAPYHLYRVDKATGERTRVISQWSYGNYAVTDGHLVLPEIVSTWCPGEGACTPGSGALLIMATDATGPVVKVPADEYAGMFLKATDQYVWFSGSGASLRRVLITGGPIDNFVVEGAISLIDATDDRAYYTKEIGSEEALYELVAAIGKEQLLASFESRPSAIRLRGGFFYWASSLSHPDIFRIPLAGGASSVALPQGEPSFDVSKQLYYSIGGCPDGALVRADPIGSWDREVWLSGLCGPVEWLVDDQNIYFIERDPAGPELANRLRQSKLP